jgi:hypothetical protein
MSRRGSRKRAGGKRPSKDEKREAARLKRQEQAERTRAAEPVLAGKTGQLNLANAGDARMVATAIKRGWIFPDKFFETIPKRVQEAAERDGLSVTAVARLTKAAAQLYGQAAAADERNNPKEPTQPQQAVNVNVGVQMIQVNESDDWYGAKPTDRRNRDAAESNGASTANPVVAGSIQSSGMRPAVGQNGVGTNGHTQGPRSLPGAIQGGD